MKKIFLPYLNIKKTNELLRKISPKILELDELNTADLSRFLEISKSVASNLVKTLKAYTFITNNRAFQFTDNGKKYISYLIRNNEKESIKILKDLVKELEYFNDIIIKLNQKGQLTISEIGNQLALLFNQTWENPQTVSTYGAALASALSFAELGFYRDGTLYKKQIGELLDSIPSPYVSAEKIIKIVEALFPIGKDIDELSNKLGTIKSRLSYEITICIELNLIERSFKGFYKLTQIGETLVSPYKKLNERKVIFRNSLLQSRYGSIIDKLKNFDKIDINIIGEVLRFEFGKYGSVWTAENTIKDYAKRFLSWLIYAEILEKTNKTHFKHVNLVPEKIDLDNTTNIEEKNKISHPINLRYYLLGKYVGILYNKNLDYETTKGIVENIISICREEKKLRPILQEWEDDYRLFLDIKDSRIFLRDIRQIEKIFGVKKI